MQLFSARAGELLLERPAISWPYMHAKLHILVRQHFDHPALQSLAKITPPNLRLSVEAVDLSNLPAVGGKLVNAITVSCMPCTHLTGSGRQQLGFDTSRNGEKSQQHEQSCEASDVTLIGYEQG